MKKRVWLLVLFILVISQCAHLKKKEPTTPVQHQSSTIHGLGYKLTVKVKARPQELEQYLFQPENLVLKTGTYALKMVSGKKIKKLGDTLYFRFEVAKLSFPFKFTLVYYQPGEEILFLGQADLGVMGFLRFRFKEMKDETKVTMNYEMEDAESFIGELVKVVNLPEAVARLMEMGVTRAQVYFDPSLKQEELLEKGVRGEFYDAFFQAHQTSVWINASLKKVNSYLMNPNTWELWKEKYGYDFGACVGREYSGPCPTRLKVRGIDYKFNSFMVSFKPPEQSISFWVSDQIIARFQVVLKPEAGGTWLIASYMMQLPPLVSQQGELMMSILQTPKYLEEMLMNVKNSCEEIS